MNERFKLVLVKLVCKDINAPDFNRYDFGKTYLAVKDSEDEEQPYGITEKGCCDMGEILIEITKSNDLYCWGGHSYVDWEYKYDYKFEEVE